MTEPDKDNLSRFFHKAAQNPEIPFQEKDWEKLEAMLEAQPADPIAAGFGSKRFYLLLAFVFVLVVGTLFIIPFTDKKELNNQLVNEEKSTSASQNSNDPVKNPADSTNTTASKVESISAAVIQKELATNATKNDASIKKGQSAGAAASFNTNANAVVAVDKNTREPNNRYSQPGSISNVPVEQKEANDRSTIQKDSTNSSGKENAQYQIASPNTQALASSSRKDSIAALVKDTLAAKKSEMPVLSDSTSNDHNARPLSRWSFQLTISPDFSTIGLQKFTSPGNAIGVVAFYQFSKSLAASIGAISSHKKYNDTAGSYGLQEDAYWWKRTNGIVPNEIQGSCNVLEIPIGIQYSVLNKTKYHVYLAAGFTSYVMLNESYQYVFNVDNPGADQGWATRKASFTAFNVTSLTVGYERKISQRISLGVAPYIKVPLSGVGSWADIKLYSLGAAFTLRYTFQKRIPPIRAIQARRTD